LRWPFSSLVLGIWAATLIYSTVDDVEVTFSSLVLGIWAATGKCAAWRQRPNSLSVPLS